eukprot:gene10798-biopygen6539
MRLVKPWDMRFPLLPPAVGRLRDLSAPDQQSGIRDLGNPQKENVTDLLSPVSPGSDLLNGQEEAIVSIGDNSSIMVSGFLPNLSVSSPD